MAERLSAPMREGLDALVAVDDDQPHSPLNRIKASSSNPSVGGMKRLLARLELIEATGVLGVNVDWVNGNYQRILFHSVRTASADRVRRMAAPRRHLALVCFLHQTWRDTLDQAVDMYGKLLDRNRKLVETRLDDMLKAQRQAVDRIVHRYRQLGAVLLDPFVLDGVLYHESDLDLEEHYTDTHGYTEINFAAFGMVGMRFCPRIRSLHRQRIYCADPDRDHGVLEPVLKRGRRAVNFRLIAEQWDRIGQFYAAFPAGHATASAALQRLNRFQASNRFYAANRELGRALKTEFVLQYMSEPQLRAKVRRGLLKVEQLHALARAVYYGQRGRISAREVYDQMNACSCLTLILACIVYWQAREISRLATAPDFPVDPDLLRHVSPIEWKNVIPLRRDQDRPRQAQDATPLACITTRMVSVPYNYAPFYSRPVECTDRDAPFVLDGVLYHESDLNLEEHYTDTHGYTEINFAAFGMVGMRFCPRIRSLHRQHCPSKPALNTLGLRGGGAIDHDPPRPPSARGARMPA